MKKYIASKAKNTKIFNIEEFITRFNKENCKDLMCKYNINSNTVMPGTIKSKMQDTIPVKDFNNIKKNIPQNRLGKPEEVAELVFFLCSENASYINGASINISGASLLD